MVWSLATLFMSVEVGLQVSNPQSKTSLAIAAGCLVLCLAVLAKLYQETSKMVG